MSNAADFFGSSAPVTLDLKQRIFFENNTNVTEDYTITTGKNAMSAGPIVIDDGVNITIPAGSVWTVI